MQKSDVALLGPLLFAIYTSPIAMIIRSFQDCHQQYADDTQLFIPLNPPIRLLTSLILLPVCMLYSRGSVSMEWL